MLLAGLIAAGYGVSAVLRLSAEETGPGADLILAGPVGRVRWALGHLLVAALGVASLLAVAGIVAGSAMACGPAAPARRRSGCWGRRWRSPGGAVVAAVAAAAFGLLPDAGTAAAWTALGFVTAVSLFGRSLRLPRWAQDASPFAFTPRLPGGSVSCFALAWLWRWPRAWPRRAWPPSAVVTFGPDAGRAAGLASKRTLKGACRAEVRV